MIVVKDLLNYFRKKNKTNLIQDSAQKFTIDERSGSVHLEAYTVDERSGSVYLEEYTPSSIFENELDDNLQNYTIDIIHQNAKSSLSNVNNQDEKDGLVADFCNWIKEENKKDYDERLPLYTGAEQLDLEKFKINEKCFHETVEGEPIKNFFKINILNLPNRWNKGISFITGSNSRSAVIEDICSEFDDVKSLAQAFKKSDIDFAKTFQEVRGIEYSEENIQKFQTQVDIYQPIYGAKYIKNTINDELKEPLEFAKNSIELNKYSVYELLEEDKQNLEENLPNLEKNIYACATLATNGDKEQAKLLLAYLIKENDIQFDPKKDCFEKAEYLVALGDALIEHSEQTYNEMLGDKSYEDYKKDFKNAYVKAFGEKNAAEASEAYMTSQENGVAIVKGAAIFAAGAAAPFTGGGSLAIAGFSGAACLGISSLESATDSDKYTTEEFLQNLKEAGATAAFSMLDIQIESFGDDILRVAYSTGREISESAIETQNSTEYIIETTTEASIEADNNQETEDGTTLEELPEFKYKEGEYTT